MIHVQIHWPVTEPQIPGDDIQPTLRETWEAMEKLVDEVGTVFTFAPHSLLNCRHSQNHLEFLAQLVSSEMQGYVRSIGISNSSVKTIKKLLETARIKPAVNQVSSFY